MADGVNDSLEELQEKLAEYRGSLATVDAALQNSPDEPQLSRLRADLLEVISLTEDLVQFKLTTETRAAELLAGAVPGSLPSEVLGGEGGGVGSPSGGPPSAGGPKGVSDFESSITTTALGGALATAAAADLLGRTCLLRATGSSVFGQIVQVKDADGSVAKEVNAATAVVGVKPFGGDLAAAAVTVPLQEIRLLPFVPDVPVGTRCHAVAAADGRIHTCAIEHYNEDSRTYQIRFFGSNATEIVKSDRIVVPRRTSEGGAGGSTTNGAGIQKKRKVVKEIVTPGGYRIPEYLQPKPTDSQRQVQVKKKKIHLLKKDQRKELVEQEAVQRQSSWLRHSKKVGTRPGAGGRVGGKESIFSSSSAPDAKIGVTNSGRGMTDFTPRERPLYSSP